MPEDVGGTPFPDGGEPDDDHDRGVPNDEFASVVFDEAFVRAATVHEPTAVERLLAAAQARAEASEAEAARRAHATSEHYDDGYGPERTGSGQDRDDDDDGPYETHVLGDGPFGLHGKQVRWHRPVAWILAVVMGIGMVALAFAAVYRGGSPGTRDRVPAPAPTGLEQGTAPPPATSAGRHEPAVSAVPRSP